MGWRYLDIVDFLLIAEAVLEVKAERLARLDRLGLADSALAAPAASFAGEEAYETFPTKVAVLGWHLIRNHPLPDGNKRVGLLAMIEFVRRNDWKWSPTRVIPPPPTRSFAPWPTEASAKTNSPNGSS